VTTPTHVVATAGHVDHGKSTLVTVLTGTDPDRLVEERRRGLTIDLGFAYTTLPSGHVVSFVDVPGHVRFLKNMLAGVGSVEAVLFVVAATEGWKPQSEEHLRILELTGVDRGVVALTKVAGLEDDWRSLVRLEVAERLAGSPLAGAPLVSVDAKTGEGLADLVRALDDVCTRAPLPADRHRPRLWVDRSFAARGAGTVVTGTLVGGALAVGEEVLVLGDRPRPARIRGLQSHHRTEVSVPPGRRAALNLLGVAHSAIHRGDAVVRPGQWAPTRLLDATLSVLAALDHPVDRRGAYLAYIGSGEHPVRLRLLDRSRLAPGETGLVRLALPTALPLLPEDRYVLREAGRDETVGGGVVLDVQPVLPASRARPDTSIERVVRERGFVEVDELERLTGQRRPPDVGGRWVADPDLRRREEQRLAESVEAAGDTGLDLAALSERERALLRGLDAVEIVGGRAHRRGTGPRDLGTHPYLAALEGSPFSPPPPDGVDRHELRALIQAGLVVDCDGTLFAARAVEAARERLADLLAGTPDGVTVATLRDALGTSRKYTLALLEYFDATGVTRRRGELHTGGPRLAEPLP